MKFDVDSDSILTKGLATLLVYSLSGHPLQEILSVSITSIFQNRSVEGLK